VRYRIEAIVAHGDGVKEFRLAPADGSAAPAWPPSAHITVGIQAADGASYRNAYSLVGTPGPQLRIAVQREAAGRGGSRTLHTRYHAGMELDVSSPRDGFQLLCQEKPCLEKLIISGTDTVHYWSSHDFHAIK